VAGEVSEKYQSQKHLPLEYSEQAQSVINALTQILVSESYTLARRTHPVLPAFYKYLPSRGELSYLAPLGSENISAPYFKQCFFQTESNTTPPSPKTEITNILFYILSFASIMKFKM